jgi:hypothetical protein
MVELKTADELALIVTTQEALDDGPLVLTAL